MTQLAADYSIQLDNTTDDPRVTAPLVLGDNDYASLTDKVCRIVEQPRPTRGWYIAFGISSTLAVMFILLIVHLVTAGVGVWGNNSPVAWGFPIVNFVFWVGIGHAGTLISAILFLLRQRWRTSINRFAEAMTIFAVICAGIFPAIHVGRVWFVYWLAPVPNQMGMWPNFRSPLMWDVFAVNTYFTVSLLFWYMGMIPDLATLRDRARTRWRALLYGILAMGWSGSQRHWHRFEMAYLLLAALATPLVVSVHSVVSFDFATSQLPGWHTTIFPPYFVAGAIFSGFAMVVTLLVPARQFFGLKEIITLRVLENMNKIILGMGCIVGYAYLTELFMAAYSGNPYESFTFINRAFGPYWPAYFIMFGCNVLAPQVFWFKKARTSIPIMLIVSLLVNVGMWFERFVIVITSLSRDFLPSSWGMFIPTWVDLAMIVGSFGLFFTLFLLFLRFLPMVAMAEVKCVMPPPRDHQQDAVQPLPSNAFNANGSTSDDERAKNVSGKPVGIMAEFKTPQHLIKSARAIAEKGFRRWDCHSPFPVHGLDEAMGIKPTILPWLVMGAGATGCAAAIAMQWWMNAVNYPFIISGKPLFSLPANIPVAFELTILFSAIAAFAGMFILNNLPAYYNPAFKKIRFLRVTTDSFFIVIDARDRLFNAAETSLFLQSLNPVAVEFIED